MAVKDNKFSVAQELLRAYSNARPEDSHLVRGVPELLVDLIAQIGEVVLYAEQKLALRQVIIGLPHGATMRDLIAVLKTKEAAELGISLEQYEALTTLFLALQAMHAKIVYSWWE
ncbi:hypothetical protein EFK68_03470 [Pseudomonas aeruginosa]|nr:hypothetical protein EFK68_03470 [Pseudomonas aeruginosa]